MPNRTDLSIILASQSPRRKDLLTQLGYSFRQLSKEVDESFSNDMPVEQVAEYLSQKKALAYETELEENDLLITSDTVVIVNQSILNKPEYPEEARAMLLKLSGKTHTVISGVCLKSLHKTTSFSVATTVYFKALKNEEIEHYIHHYKPFDKAGAYGIQEWIGFIGVEKIEGSFYNVMGLPLKELYEAIESF